MTKFFYNVEFLRQPFIGRTRGSSFRAAGPFPAVHFGQELHLPPAVELPGAGA